jgi:diguanylate cyclase (GGDEF)-like protein
MELQRSNREQGTGPGAERGGGEVPLHYRRRTRQLLAIIFLLGTVLSAAVYLRTGEVKGETARLIGADIPALQAISDLKSNIVAQDPILYEYYAAWNTAKFRRDFAANQTRINNGLAVIQRAFPDRSEADSIEVRQERLRDFAADLDRTLSVADTDWDRARRLLAEIAKISMANNRDLDRLVEVLRAEVGRRGDRTGALVRDTALLALGFSIAVLVLAMVVGYYGNKSLAASWRLAHAAFHDALTGLPNRRQYIADMDRRLAGGNSRHGAVLLIGVDRFKGVNESFGHAVGDAVLRGVAARLRRIGGDGGSAGVVYRFEGDTFAAVASGADADDLPARAVRAFAEPLVVEGREFFLTLSIGVARFPDDGHDAVTLLKHADSAAQQVRRDGGDAVLRFSAALNAAAIERLNLENALRRAVERGELRLEYQPQIDIDSGRVVGSEALLRWQHPGLGRVSPAKFIPLAEQSGSIVEIGEWVLRAACRQNRDWARVMETPPVVGVNVSARQLRDAGFPATVAAVLAETNLPPRLLEIEITESAAMADVEKTIQVLNEVKALGVRISIDDFGTGYSSLSYLRRLPFDRLKIDQSFVRNLTGNDDDRVIVELILGLAHQLGAEVIAEGVETEAHLELLRRLGCDEAQGYVIARPLAAEEIPGFAAARA